MSVVEYGVFVVLLVEEFPAINRVSMFLLVESRPVKGLDHVPELFPDQLVQQKTIRARSIGTCIEI